MKHLTFISTIFFFSVCILAGIAQSGDRRSAVIGNRACTLGVTNVNLVPMTEDVVRSGQTIWFSRSGILGISATPEDVAGCDRIVDGAGRFLLPGLNDLHTHVASRAFQQGLGLAPEPLPFDALMAPYLVNGITGIRILSGSPDLLEYRDSSRHSNRAPHLVVASPMLSATPPVLPEPITRIANDPENARAAVREYAAAGYDLIKIRRNLARPVFEAVLDEAHRVGLHVDGHITRDAEPLEQLLSMGQDGFAHLDEFANKTPHKVTVQELIAMLAKCNCYISTAIGVTRNISEQIGNYDGLVARDEMQVVSPMVTGSFWLKPNNPYLREGAPAEFFDGLAERTSNIIRPLYDAGIPLLAGSDAINPMIIPGYGLLDELDLLVGAGLSEYEALRTATAIPAAWVPGFEKTGLLESGQMANAVLLASNPLEGLEVLRRPDAVILNGYFLEQSELDARLDAAVRILQRP